MRYFTLQKYMLLAQKYFCFSSLLGRPSDDGCIPKEHAHSSSKYDIIFTDIIGVGIIKNMTGPLYSKYK